MDVNRNIRFGIVSYTFWLVLCSLGKQPAENARRNYVQYATLIIIILVCLISKCDPPFRPFQGFVHSFISVKMTHMG